MQRRMTLGGRTMVVLFALMSSVIVASPAWAYDCIEYAGEPYKEFSTIKAQGYLNCRDVDQDADWVQVSLQRHRWYGWQTLTTDWKDNNRDMLSVTTEWDCSGAGTYTYRLQVTAEDTNGTTYSVTSGEFRTSC